MVMKYPKDFINKIICGNCLDIMPLIPNKSIDMILADLPYGVTACEWDISISLESLWKQYKRIIKNNGAIILMANQPFTSVLVMSNPNEFKRCLYWKKERGTGFARAKKEELRIIEDILIFSDNTIKYNPAMKKLKKPYTHCLPIRKSYKR